MFYSILKLPCPEGKNHQLMIMIQPIALCDNLHIADHTLCKIITSFQPTVKLVTLSFSDKMIAHIPITKDAFTYGAVREYLHTRMARISANQA